MTRILLLACLVFGLTFIPSANASHHKKIDHPASCFKKAGWTLRNGSNNHGGSASIGNHSVTWLRIYVPGIPFLTLNSGNLTSSEFATQLSCVGRNTVPNVAP